MALPLISRLPGAVPHSRGSIRTAHFLVALTGTPASRRWQRILTSDPQPQLLTSDSRLAAWWSYREPRHAFASQSDRRVIRLQSGDRCNETAPCAGCCASTSVEIDVAATEFLATTGSVGLPPMYLFSGNDIAAVTSAPALMPALLGEVLALDSEAVLELLRIGYPQSTGTVYRSLRWLPAASACRVFIDNSSQPRARIEPVTVAVSTDSGRTPEDLFLESIRLRDVGQSVLSLTAGVDSRAILAACLFLDVTPPAITLAGRSRRSVDAIVAAQLCRDAGLRHDVVRLDHAFENNLAFYVERASLLSGGLASVTEAHEVFFAERVRERGLRRISGIAANQLVRSGFEAVRLRSADRRILTSEFVAGVHTPHPRAHLLRSLPEDPYALRELLLRQELPLASQANFSIGNSYYTQQVPYADSALARAIPPAPSRALHHLGSPALHLSDLRHRFFGEHHDSSFQLALIRRAGGMIARTPINWGWTPHGSISVRGRLRGIQALLDILVSRSAALRGLRQSVRVEGTHVIRDLSQWLVGPLSALLQDTLRSDDVRTSGILEFSNLIGRLDRVRRPHPNDHAALIAALDVALAMQLSKPRSSAAVLSAFGFSSRTASDVSLS
jgi:hypothetical protein